MGGTNLANDAEEQQPGSVQRGTARELVAAELKGDGVVVIAVDLKAATCGGKYTFSASELVDRTAGPLCSGVTGQEPGRAVIVVRAWGQPQASAGAGIALLLAATRRARCCPPCILSVSPSPHRLTLPLQLGMEDIVTEVKCVLRGEVSDDYRALADPALPGGDRLRLLDPTSNRRFVEQLRLAAADTTRRGGRGVSMSARVGGRGFSGEPHEAARCASLFSLTTAPSLPVCPPSCPQPAAAAAARQRDGDRLPAGEPPV